MRINGIDEINDSDEILEQKQEGEDNKGLEKEKESGLYPTEKLEERRDLFIDKSKANLHSFFLKSGMDVEKIDMMVDFIQNHNVHISIIGPAVDAYGELSIDFEGKKIKLKKVYSSCSVKTFSKEPLSEEETLFIETFQEILILDKGVFGDGAGSLRNLSYTNKMTVEIEENKQNLPDEDWIDQEIMTPKVKAVYYKIREIYEKAMEIGEPGHQRPEDWGINKDFISEGKIIVYFNGALPEKITTPYGTYETTPISYMNGEKRETFMEELGKNFDLKMDLYTGDFKIEVDY